MPLNPDTYTRISLIGTTERLHAEHGDRDHAIVDVQQIARGRTDLLAQAAGHFLAIDTWNSPSCYQLLVDAGADPDLIPSAAEQTRWNLSRMGHTTAGTQAPARTLAPRSSTPPPGPATTPRPKPTTGSSRATTTTSCTPRPSPASLRAGSCSSSASTARNCRCPLAA